MEHFWESDRTLVLDFEGREFEFAENACDENVTPLICHKLLFCGKSAGRSPSRDVTVWVRGGVHCTRRGMSDHAPRPCSGRPPSPAHTCTRLPPRCWRSAPPHAREHPAPLASVPFPLVPLAPLDSHLMVGVVRSWSARMASIMMILTHRADAHVQWSQILQRPEPHQQHGTRERSSTSRDGDRLWQSGPEWHRDAR